MTTEADEVTSNNMLHEQKRTANQTRTFICRTLNPNECIKSHLFPIGSYSNWKNARVSFESESHNMSEQTKKKKTIQTIAVVI